MAIHQSHGTLQFEHILQDVDGWEEKKVRGCYTRTPLPNKFDEELRKYNQRKKEKNGITNP